jgi:hypothetical protein
MTDGRELDFEGHFGLLADRVELERHFGISIATSNREEHLAFMVWRCATRSLPEFASQTFETFLESVGDFEVIGEAQIDVPPTEPEAPIG